MKLFIHKLFALVVIAGLFAPLSARAAIDATGLPSLRTQSTQETLQTLSRDTDNAHKTLGKIFDQKKIADQQELSKAFGEVAFQLVGDLAKKLDWKEGSTQKVLLHGIVAAVQAGILVTLVHRMLLPKRKLIDVVAPVALRNLKQSCRAEK